MRCCEVAREMSFDLNLQVCEWRCVVLIDRKRQKRTENRDVRTSYIGSRSAAVIAVLTSKTLERKKWGKKLKFD